MAAWHLGMLGAEVVKVEPPTGDVARSWGTGAVFDLLNSGKRCVSLDPATAPGAEELRRLCARADAVLADADLVPEVAEAAGGDRLRAVVTIDAADVPGGHGTGETLAQAALALTSYVGEWDGEPVRVGADLASVTAAAHAAQAVLAGLLQPPGQGPLCARVSIARSLACEKTIHWAARSDPDAWTGYHVAGRDRPPDTGWQARDGAMTLEFPPEQYEGWCAFCREAGLEELIEEFGEGWYGTVGMEDRADWARSRYEAALGRYQREEAAELIRRHGGWSVPFLRAEEVLRHPQGRLFAAALATEEGYRLRLPWLVGDEVQGEHRFTQAPAIGAHDQEVLGAFRSGLGER
jgi:crotonobetainyl-CoA:carnitine CoA-transferase CaiB-like acyl-CoA transferase